MRIGLISDTHIPDAATTLPPQVLEALSGVDLILHAGDLFEASVLDELELVAPVLAARGDDDFWVQDQRVRDVQTLTVEGLELYVIHSSHFWARELVECPEKHGLETAPDVVIFGHTHRDTVLSIGDSLLVNPGSPTFPQYQLRLGTVAILDINNGKARARIVQLQNKVEG
jgi:putative phosphoesterase